SRTRHVGAERRGGGDLRRGGRARPPQLQMRSSSPAGSSGRDSHALTMSRGGKAKREKKIKEDADEQTSTQRARNARVVTCACAGEAARKGGGFLERSNRWDFKRKRV
ncbi:hypothetical protein TGARI_286270C, partial [Toxoplasma gondii ARI]